MTTTSSIENGTRPGTNRSSIAVLFIVCWAVFFGVLNASAIGVVLPSIAEDLGTDISQVSWIMTGFLLVYGVAIPFYGRLADLHGARRLFIFGIALFSVGSLLSAIAPNFETLLGARLIQAVGGAAAPGLGMVLASKAFGTESRGMVIGVIGATIGVGAAIGPLLGGLLANVWGWESIFVANAAAAIAIPIGLRVLPKNEAHLEGHLDIPGGILLALAVTGILLAPSQASQHGWASGLALGGLALAAVSLVLFVIWQNRSKAPFIPAEFRRNTEYILLVTMSFLLMASMTGALIGLPIMMAVFNDASALTIGWVLLPGAILSAITGVVSGKLLGRVSASSLMIIGGILMLAGVVGLSAASGGNKWPLSVYAALVGGGLGLVNTPLATTVTKTVPLSLLSSALGVNSMMFFVGGSIGAAILLGFSTSTSSTSLNPLHSGAAVGFSDGYLVLAIPVLLIIALASRVGRSTSAARVATAPEHEWSHDCSVPWSPELAETTASSVVQSGN